MSTDRTLPAWRGFGKFVILGLCIGVGLPACSTTGELVQKSDRPEAVVDPALKIIILPAKVTFERIENGEVLNGKDYGAERIEGHLRDAVQTACLGHRLHAVEVNPLTQLNGAKREALVYLAKHPERLLSSMSIEAKSRLLEFIGSEEQAAVLVQYVRVKVGPRGTWNMVSGQITSAMSSSLLRAALIEGQTGRVLWQNHAYFREVAGVQNSVYQEAVRTLYESLCRK